MRKYEEDKLRHNNSTTKQSTIDAPPNDVADRQSISFGTQNNVTGTQNNVTGTQNNIKGTQNIAHGPQIVAAGDVIVNSGVNSLVHKKEYINPWKPWHWWLIVWWLIADFDQLKDYKTNLSSKGRMRLIFTAAWATGALCGLPWLIVASVADWLPDFIRFLEQGNEFTRYFAENWDFVASFPILIIGGFPSKFALYRSYDLLIDLPIWYVLHGLITGSIAGIVSSLLVFSGNSASGIGVGGLMIGGCTAGLAYVLSGKIEDNNRCAFAGGFSYLFASCAAYSIVVVQSSIFSRDPGGVLFFGWILCSMPMHIIAIMLNREERTESKQ